MQIFAILIEFVYHQFQAVKKSRDWPLVDLELFAAKISEIIELFRDKWDRTQLPHEIDAVIRNWNSLN